MRAAIVAIVCVMGCTTQAPTPSPGASTSPAPSGSPAPTLSPTPVPTTESGFPSSILGLTVHSVAEMHRLAADGALDGRFAAVAGHWGQSAIPCPYVGHQAVLDGFCTGGVFADDPEVASQMGGDINSTGMPLPVPETANGDKLWSLGPPGAMGASGAGAVVLIIHGADSRARQCEAIIRADCEHRLVIDDVAWVSPDPTTLQPSNSDLPADALHLNVEDVAAAAVQPGEQLVTAYPVRATDLNEIDPRLLGQGSGIVWFARVMSGAPDADGIAPGKLVLVSDETGSVVTTLPLGVDPAFSPARLVLDSNGQVPGPEGRAHFAVTLEGRVIAQEWLDSSSTPLALAPGDYEVHAWAGTGAITSPPSVPECDLPLSLGAGDDVAYYAHWPGGRDCVWKAGE